MLATALGIGGGTAAAGAGIGALAGGLLSALASLGISEEEAKQLEAGFQAGAALLTVDAGVQAAEARVIFQRNGVQSGARTATV